MSYVKWAAEKIGVPVFMIFAVFYITGYLNPTAPDVHYSLTPKTPIPFLPMANAAGTNQPESEQILIVRNTGASEAKGIVVKIDKPIKDHVLRKHSQVDAATESKPGDPLEIDYPSLPPAGSFQIFVKCGADEIASRDVHVTSGNTRAYEEVAENKPGTSSVVLNSLLIAYSILILAGIRVSLVNIWTHSMNRSPINILVSKTRWIATETEWVRVITERLDHPYYYRADLSKHPSHQLLQLNRPDHVKDETWQDLVNAAVDALSTQYAKALNASIIPDDLIRLLKTERPTAFPVDKWDELTGKASEAYVDKRRCRLPVRHELLANLQEPKPEELASGQWAKLRNHWQDELVRDMLRQPGSLEECKEELRKSQPEGLDADRWKTIRERLEQHFLGLVSAQLWRSNDVAMLLQSLPLAELTLQSKDWIERESGRIAHYRQAERSVEAATELLARVIRDGSIPGEKPSDIDRDRWDEMERIAGQVRDLQTAKAIGTQNREKEAALAQKEADLQQKIDKVTRQLELINQVLRDPTAADRVEWYNDTFARGNLENLRRLADAAKKPARKGRKGTNQKLSEDSLGVAESGST